MPRSCIKKWLVAFIGISFLVPQWSWAENVLHRGNWDEPTTLDLHHSVGCWSLSLLQDLYEGLVSLNAKGEIIPGVAESWEINHDQKEYTFYLRPTARWSNGDPVTSHDFIRSFQRLLNPRTQADYAWVFFTVEGAEDIHQNTTKNFSKLGVSAVDDYTLKINLKAPTPYFLESLAFHKFAPLHANAHECFDFKGKNVYPVFSNGPFRFVRWIPGKVIELEKNEHFYAADTVTIDRIFYYPTKDRNMALQRFQAGELDIIDDIPINKLKWIRQNLPQALYSEESSGTYYYIFNTTKKPFNNPILRQALSMAIDRDQLTILSHAQKHEAFSYVPPVISGYTPQNAFFADWPQEKRDQEAKKILADLGYSSNNPLHLELYYDDNKNHERIAITIASLWRDKLGIYVTLHKNTVEEHVKIFKNKNFEVGHIAWLADYPDPQNFLGLLETKSNFYNFSHYQNQQFNQLMQEASLTTDPQQRLYTLQKAEKIAVDDQPMIPLFYMARHYLLQPHIKGWEANKRSIHPSRYITLAPKN